MGGNHELSLPVFLAPMSAIALACHIEGVAQKPSRLLGLQHPMAQPNSKVPVAGGPQEDCWPCPRCSTGGKSGHSAGRASCSPAASRIRISRVMKITAGQACSLPRKIRLIDGADHGELMLTAHPECV